jgi:hypothetical protein
MANSVQVRPIYNESMGMFGLHTGLVTGCVALGCWASLCLTLS